MDKAAELKQVTLANRLHRELENKSMEQVLKEHLPASDPARLSAAARDICHGVEESYSAMDEQVDSRWVESRLNSALAGHSCDEQGKWLVNLINYAVSVKPEGFEEDPHWQELREADSFREEDVADLLSMAIRCTESSAGFFARQEFLVMERALGKLPRETVESQVNSGAAYAEAYAAAMYITGKQSGATGSVTPYEMGLVSANSVESSRLLALYHYGRLRLETLMSGLKKQATIMLGLAGKMLLHTIALGLRLTIASLNGQFVFDLLTVLGVMNSGILFVAFVGMAALALGGISQEETVEALTRIWNGIRSGVGKLIDFFSGHASSASDVEAAEIITNDETQVEVPVCICDSITI